MGKYTFKTSRAKELKKEKINNVYYYSITPSSSERGYNRTINLFIILKKDYSIVEISNYCINTVSYKGDRSIANNMISDIFGHKMKNGYDLLSNKIKVYSIN